MQAQDALQMKLRLRAEKAPLFAAFHVRPPLAEAVNAMPRLGLRGLMSIPDPATEETAQRAPFRRLCELLLDLNRRGHSLDTLSMGMSGDLEAAIAEGATIVRVGTAIFGPRT